MASLHEINGGYLGTRLELPSSEPSYDFFASFQGSGEPSAPNAAYGENGWATTSRDSDGYFKYSGSSPKVIFSQPLTQSGTWTLEFYAKSDSTSAPEWVCLWTGLDQRHRHVNTSQFHNYGDPGIYNGAHFRSNVTTYDGNWHHYMWSNDAGTLSFYVDGTERITNPNNNSAHDLYGIHLGQWYLTSTPQYDSQHFFKNMRVTYGSALTSASPIPTFAAGDTPSGVYKLGSKDSLITSFATAGSAASLTKKVGRLDGATPANWFSAGYVGIDLSAYFENGKTYTQFKIRRPQTTDDRTLTPCIMGRDINTFYAVGGFTATIPGDASSTVGDIITFDLTDPNLPGKFGSFTVPFGGQYFMGWQSGSGTDNTQTALLAEKHSTTANACVSYVQTNVIPSLTNHFGMSNSDTAVAMQMEWS